MKGKLNFKFVFMALLFFSMISASMSGQQTITGTITDAITGEGLIGANVLIKGTSKGATSDFDGNYSLEALSTDVLEYSYIGYQTQDILVGDQSTINVSMTSGQLLDEVVLIGYGEIKREDVTGSLQTVNQEDFNKGAITAPEQLLSGKIAGVNISTDGSPGGGSTIRIRGTSSLSATNDPLIVVDGVPLDNKQISGGRNNLNIINPNDIESMTVLKDASATAIYGNRASAGVILITTKKGKLSDGIKVGYNAKVSLGKVINNVDVLNAEEFRKLVIERNGIEGEKSLLLGDSDTDWQEAIFQDAFGHEHNLNFSGGVGIVPVRASIGYSDFNGLLKTDNFNRVTGSVNLSPGFLDNKLQVNLGLKASRSKNRFADKGAVGAAVGFDPTQSIYSNNDDFGGYFTWRQDGETGDIVGLAPANPLALLEQKEDVSTVDRYIVNASADYRMPFLPALRANLNLAYDYSVGEGTKYVDTIAGFSYNEQTGGGEDNSYKQVKKNQLLEFYLNYKEKLFGNDFDVMTGYSWQRFYLDNSFSNSDIRRNEENTKSGYDASELFMLSLFGRVNYSLNDRVLLTATIRNDHTSRFSPENRSGVFPALAAAIKVIENDSKYFNNIKARFGWGVTGQQDLSDDYYLYQGLYTRGDANVNYGLGDGYLTTYRPDGYDENIRWETTSTYNIGFDMSIFLDRLSASVDLYKKYTKDLLNNETQVPVGSNLTNVVPSNIGNMESEGIEISLNYAPIITKSLEWNININASVNKSEITKLNIDDRNSIGQETGGISGGVGNNIQINTVGYRPNSFYVYEQIYDESGAIIPGEFVDRNDDGVVNVEDKYRIETSSPRVVLGLANQMNYKTWSFSFAGRAYLGNQIYNNVKTQNGFSDRVDNLAALQNVHISAIENNIADQNDILHSDAFIEDASFFRMDHITLGYDLSNILGKSFNIYTTVQNAFIITPYDGIEPEVDKGIDNNIYPRSRNFIFGLNVQF